MCVCLQVGLLKNFAFSINSPWCARVWLHKFDFFEWVKIIPRTECETCECVRACVDVPCWYISWQDRTWKMPLENVSCWIFSAKEQEKESEPNITVARADGIWCCAVVAPGGATCVRQMFISKWCLHAASPSHQYCGTYYVMRTMYMM